MAVTRWGWWGAGGGLTPSPLPLLLATLLGASAVPDTEPEPWARLGVESGVGTRSVVAFLRRLGVRLPVALQGGPALCLPFGVSVAVGVLGVPCCCFRVGVGRRVEGEAGTGKGLGPEVRSGEEGQLCEAGSAHSSHSWQESIARFERASASLLCCLASGARRGCTQWTGVMGVGGAPQHRCRTAGSQPRRGMPRDEALPGLNHNRGW